MSLQVIRNDLARVKADAYQLIGDCYGMLGHRDEAEKYWQLAVERPAFG